MRKIRKPCGFHCIRVKDLGVEIGNQTILEHVNLHIHCGSLTAIVGRNGAGKSTLVRAILGDIPHSGTIEFRDVEDGRVKKLKIGYVPQSINIEAHTPMDVYDLIVSYRYRFPVFLKNRKIYEQVREALEIFEAADLIDKSVGTLSGGELQRVLLSMAVMDEPNLLLLDEPVSGIDKNGMDLFYEKMDYLRKNYDMAIALISHDLDYVAKYADKVLLIDKTVLADGSAREVFSSGPFRQVFGELDYPFPGTRDKKRAGSEDVGDRCGGKEPLYQAAYRGKE